MVPGRDFQEGEELFGDDDDDVGEVDAAEEEEAEAADSPVEVTMVEKVTELFWGGGRKPTPVRTYFSLTSEVRRF